MHLLITGASGFIGQALCQHWQGQHQLTLVSREPAAHRRPGKGRQPHFVKLSQLQDLTPFDGIVNLAGEPILGRRWSQAQKQRIGQSRWQITARLVDLLSRSQPKPRVWLNASAVGYYGWHGGEALDETRGTIAPGFTHDICARWEELAQEASQWGARVCLLRLGMVLGRQGGALAGMLPAYRLGLGATLGAGQQIYSWIALPDLLRALDFLLKHDECQGAYNLTSPQPISQADFSRQLAQALGRPHWLHLPAGLLSLLLGERASLLLKGQRVLPSRLQAAGFAFDYPSLDQALPALLR
ncbi:TIGR01777 family oxidoreductase [Pseudaeromonas sp. ZJS20]|uniref:TIGR01777 family oxidoreductase n=1 Tax=Pseudaeromonas aegiceratis TaxID=3153928 RepID=UPI00390C49A2